MTAATRRNGYVFLMSVLFIGAIATAVASTSLLLGWMEMRDSRVFERSSRAFLLAQNCADRGVMELFNDNAFVGGTTVTTEDGECSILLTGGSGNENRTLCAEGVSGGAVKRLEIVLQRILPSVHVLAWREVSHFTLCSYAPDFSSAASE
ncbi:MAG: hypothetical protein V1926_01485 [Candidatus Peregrinibacteria bacterium]